MDLVGLRSLRVPRSREELRLGPRSAPLAGGTWLYSEPQPGLEDLVDLAGLGWDPIERGPDGSLRIAATCTVARLAAIEPDPRWGRGVDRLFRQAAESLLASWKIWNAATVGGNVCMALPAGAMIALAVALDGEAVIWQSNEGERRLPVVDFVRGVRETALLPGELLRAIELPAAALAARVALRRASLAPLGRSAALLLARRDAGGAFVLTVTASVPAPRRLWFPQLPSAEELAAALDAGGGGAEGGAAEEGDAAGGGGWFDDPHGSPAWRRAVSLALAEELRTELSEAEASEGGA